MMTLCVYVKVKTPNAESEKDLIRDKAVLFLNMPIIIISQIYLSG